MNISIHSCQYASEKMTMLHAVDRMKYMVKYFGIDVNDGISAGQGFTRSGYDAVGHLDCVCKITLEISRAWGTSEIVRHVLKVEN